MAKHFMDLPGEIWKPVPYNPEQYHVSSYGRVCNVKRGRLISQKDRKSGYARVGIHINNTQKTWMVHALVCEAFHGPRPQGMQAAHYNGDRLDNRPSNLRWATAIENAKDRMRHGTVCQGSGHPRAKLTEELVLELRRRHAIKPFVYKDLAASLGMDPASVRSAILGLNWRHI